MKYKYKLSKEVERSIERFGDTPEEIAALKKMTLQLMVEELNGSIPNYPPRTPDGRDISLEECRRELEEELGLERI